MLRDLSGAGTLFCRREFRFPTLWLAIVRTGIYRIQGFTGFKDLQDYISGDSNPTPPLSSFVTSLIGDVQVIVDFTIRS